MGREEAAGKYILFYGTCLLSSVDDHPFNQLYWFRRGYTLLHSVQLLKVPQTDVNRLYKLLHVIQVILGFILNSLFNREIE